MNTLSLVTASILARPLNAALCLLASAAGIALLCFIFLLSQGISDGFLRHARGIDVIAGTKGSPLQLILSSIYHADVPAGNISMKDYEQIARNPQVRQAIPLALGDNYKGWRMVGTTPAYLELYNAQTAKGRLFSAPFEAVAGAATGIKAGDIFTVSHGFSVNNDDAHNDKPYTVTGVLKPTGTVLDTLLITNYESVQQLHAHHEEHGHHDHGHDHDYHDHHDEETSLTRQVTAVLIKVKNPADMLSLPRRLNESSRIMAAVPAYEMARFAKNLGIGRDVIIYLSAGFMALSALILFSSLASNLALRRYDLAVMRVMGASPARLFITTLLEGLLLSGTGAIIGIISGHLMAYGIVASLDTLNGLILANTLLIPQWQDLYLIALGLFIGLLASLIPSVLSARTNIAALLAKGRA